MRLGYTLCPGVNRSRRDGILSCGSLSIGESLLFLLSSEFKLLSYLTFWESLPRSLHLPSPSGLYVQNGGSAREPQTFWVQQILQQKTKALHVGFNKFNRPTTTTWLHKLYTLHGHISHSFCIITTSLTTAHDCYSSSSALCMTGSPVLLH